MSTIKPHTRQLEWNQGLGGEIPVVKLQVLNNRNIWSRYNRKYSPEKKMKSLSTVLKISDVTFNTNDEHWESECHVNQEVKTLEPGLSKRRDPGQKQCCRMSKGKGRTAVAQVKVKRNKESGGTQRCEGCLLMCSCTGSSGVIRRVPRSQGQLSPRPMFYLHRAARSRRAVMGRTCSIMTKHKRHHGYDV